MTGTGGVGAGFEGFGPERRFIHGPAEVFDVEENI
jgi:hypothetical protein